MFGYIRVRKPELKIREYDEYRCYYCGLCRSLKKTYNVSAELLLTYDFTFLVLLLSSVYDLNEKRFTSRCIVHPFRRHKRITTEADTYAADMSMLLGFWHFMDDRADSKDPVSFLLSLIFRRRAVKAAMRHPGKAEVIKAGLHDLHRLEGGQCKDAEKLSDCFGQILAEIFVWKKDGFEKYFRQMGYHMGRFIYLMDAVDDWEKDIRHGEFNPYSAEKSLDQVISKALPLLTSEISDAAKAFEMLPVTANADLLRNIIYAGVWNRFDTLSGLKDKAPIQ